MLPLVLWPPKQHVIQGATVWQMHVPYPWGQDSFDEYMNELKKQGIQAA